MKKILLIIAIFIGVLDTYAQKVDYIENENDVLLLGEKVDGLQIQFGTIMGAHYIEVYTDGNTKEYFLKIDLQTPETMVPQLFLANSKMLFKVSKKDIIELTSVYHSHLGYGTTTGITAYNLPSFHSVAYFPITEEQITKISKKSIIKARLEVLAYNEKEGVKIKYHDYKLKVHKMGSFIKAVDENIELGLNRSNYKKFDRSNVSEGF